MIVDCQNLERELQLKADVVVIGTGAGGSVMLRELALAGANVIAFEEGADHPYHSFSQREEEMLPKLFQDRGGRMTDDLAINVLQGRGLGGSTIHNTNLCKRIAPEMLASWKRHFGLDTLADRAMQDAFLRIEQDLHVMQIDDARINANNRILQRGLVQLAWRGGPLAHNRTGCVGSGFCELGCAYNAKNHARKILIPQALEAGAAIYTSATVMRIEHDEHQVSGVLALASNGRPVHVRCPVVVLSASAIGSAFLALTSQIPDRYGLHGGHLHMHPGGVVAGVFSKENDAQIEGWKGIPQSYECTEFLDLHEGSDKRVWITTAFAHPIGTAVSTPGFGKSHMQRMRNYARMSVLTAMVHDETSGYVYVNRDKRPAIKYKMNEGDRRQLMIGLQACVRILLAAGASEVMVPGVPPVTIKNEREIERIDMGFVRPHHVPLTAVHPMSTMRMGANPRESVVNPFGEHHQLRGLFVADGSLFPTSIGGPPQIPIYATSLRLAPYVVAATKRRA